MMDVVTWRIERDPQSGGFAHGATLVEYTGGSSEIQVDSGRCEDPKSALDALHSKVELKVANCVVGEAAFEMLEKPE
jgi:hypothetical protein